MINMLQDLGIKSEAAYTAALSSIGLSLVAWGRARRKEDRAHADRKAIFVGLWAPTFFQLGNALRIAEDLESSSGSGRILRRS